jgi:hypothetical protein
VTSTRRVASALLNFLKQEEDLETIHVLKRLDRSQLLQPTPKTHLEIATPQPIIKKTVQAQASIKAETSANATSQEIKQNPISIYARLAEKVKKACPELRIKDHFDIKKAGIPDCDVVFLGSKILPDVYGSLVKAIDKQLALTETVVMDQDLISDLLIKHYKLILVPESLKSMKALMSHVKFQPDLISGHIGSSPIIILESPEALSQNIAKKQALWQKIKTILA